jgi:hypothetical protein
MHMTKPTLDPANPHHAAAMREMIRALRGIARDCASGDDALTAIAHHFGDHPPGSADIAAIRTMLSEMQRESDETLAHLLDVITRPQQSSRKHRN